MTTDQQVERVLRRWLIEQPGIPGSPTVILPVMGGIWRKEYGRDCVPVLVPSYRCMN